VTVRVKNGSSHSHRSYRAIITGKKNATVKCGVYCQSFQLPEALFKECLSAIVHVEIATTVELICQLIAVPKVKSLRFPFPHAATCAGPAPLDTYRDLNLSAVTQFQTMHKINSLRGRARNNVDHVKQSWPGLGVKCPFCSHSKCPACVDVSCNILACCSCRARAISRLAHLKEVYGRRESNCDEEAH
jgi:hypothetical protein